MGIFWSISGSFDPLGIYDSQFAQSFWGTPILPEDAARAKSFLLGPFGATSAAYFMLQYFIVKHAYAQQLKWGYQAIMMGFFFWFFLDTFVCIYHQAYFNILLANIPCLIMMLPLVFTRKYFV